MKLFKDIKSKTERKLLEFFFVPVFLTKEVLKGINGININFHIIYKYISKNL